MTERVDENARLTDEEREFFRRAGVSPTHIERIIASRIAEACSERDRWKERWAGTVADGQAALDALASVQGVG